MIEPLPLAREGGIQFSVKKGQAMKPCICGHDKYVHLHGANNNEFCGKCKCLDFTPVGKVKVKVSSKSVELDTTERIVIIQMCKKFIDRGGFDQDILFDIMEKMK